METMIETLSIEEIDIINYVDFLIFNLELKTGKEIYAQITYLDTINNRAFFDVRFTTDHKFYSIAYSISSIHDDGEKEGLERFLNYLFLE